MNADDKKIDLIEKEGRGPIFEGSDRQAQNKRS